MQFRSMRQPGPCEERCEAEFTDCTRRSTFAARVSGRAQRMHAPLCATAKERKSTAQEGAGPRPRKNAEPRLCGPFVGLPQQPDDVSQRLIDGWMGKRAKLGEQGEGCRQKPWMRPDVARKSALLGTAISSRGCNRP